MCNTSLKDRSLNMLSHLQSTLPMLALNIRCFPQSTHVYKIQLEKHNKGMYNFYMNYSSSQTFTSWIHAIRIIVNKILSKKQNVNMLYHRSCVNLGDSVQNLFKSHLKLVHIRKKSISAYVHADKHVTKKHTILKSMKVCYQKNKYFSSLQLYFPTTRALDIFIF